MPSRVVTFKLDEELLEKIDHLARDARKTRSDIIREAVQIYLARINQTLVCREARRIRVYW